MNRITKRSAALLVLLVFCMTLILRVLLINKEIFVADMPSEPQYFGTFPKTLYWLFEATGDVVSTPALKDDVLYVKTQSTLYAVNILKKQVLWKVESWTQSRLSVEPIITQSSVVVVEGTSNLAAYAIDSGVLLWKAPVSNNAASTIVSVDAASANSHYLYVGRYESRLTAYDLRTGIVIWEYGLPGRTHPYIAANEEYVFLAADKMVMIFDAFNGSRLWQLDVGYAGPILLSGDNLYIADEEKGALISLNIDSRKVVWEVNYQDYIRAYNFSCMSETEEHILFAARKLIMVSKHDGKVLWSTNDLGVLECPVMLGNEVYIRDSLNTLYLIDVKTGQETGKILVRMNSKMKHDFFRGPVAGDGLLIVPFGDNRVYFYQK